MSQPQPDLQGWCLDRFNGVCLQGTSWSTAPLSAPCTLQGSSIKTVLWIGSNAVESEFTASLSRGTPDGEWSSLCGATGNTLFREGAGTPLPLPGKDMVAASANGGFSVALPLSMGLAQGVELQAGDVSLSQK